MLIDVFIISVQGGTDFGLIIETIESLTVSKLNNQSNVGGYSSIYLIITKQVPNENQKTYAATKIEEIKKKYPGKRHNTYFSKRSYIFLCQFQIQE